MRGKSTIAAILVAGMFLIASVGTASHPLQASGLRGTHILVMSKTAGYRHGSIPVGQATIRELAREQSFTVAFTEDSAQFNDANLGQFDAVIFLNTTGDILDSLQQESFERYIKAGHGMLGIHSAADTETDGMWPLYTALIGARFKSHPAIQEARIVIADQTGAVGRGASLAGLGEFKFTDEWYDFNDLSPTLIPLLRIDRASYAGSTATGTEPIVWRNAFSGGRAFYIGLGHRDQTYASPIMREMILQGLRYAVGRPASLGRRSAKIGQGRQMTDKPRTEQ